MSLERRVLWLVAGGLLIGGTTALARRAPAGNDNPVNPGSSLNPSEISQQSADYMTKMKATELRASKLQDDARKKKDVVKLNCVADKVVQIKGHLAVADQTMAGLATAIARSDGGETQHEFTRITLIFQKVTVLGTEAENCIGEDAAYVGDTKVDVDIDPTIPSEDPTEPQLPLPDVSRPPEASPFI
jgi:hypothetical protein